MLMPGYSVAGPSVASGRTAAPFNPVCQYFAFGAGNAVLAARGIPKCAEFAMRVVR